MYEFRYCFEEERDFNVKLTDIIFNLHLRNFLNMEEYSWIETNSISYFIGLDKIILFRFIDREKG